MYRQSTSWKTSFSFIYICTFSLGELAEEGPPWRKVNQSLGDKEFTSKNWGRCHQTRCVTRRAMWLLFLVMFVFLFLILSHDHSRQSAHEAVVLLILPFQRSPTYVSIFPTWPAECIDAAATERLTPCGREIVYSSTRPTFYVSLAEKNSPFKLRPDLSFCCCLYSCNTHTHTERHRHTRAHSRCSNVFLL